MHVLFDRRHGLDFDFELTFLFIFTHNMCINNKHFNLLYNINYYCRLYIQHKSNYVITKLKEPWSMSVYNPNTTNVSHWIDLHCALLLFVYFCTDSQSLGVEDSHQFLHHRSVLLKTLVQRMHLTCRITKNMINCFLRLVGTLVKNW